MLNIILLSIISVSVPLIIGGLLSFFLKSKEEKVVNSFVFISLGTLLFLICIELLPELIELSADINSKLGILYLILCVLFFLFVVIILHKLIDKLFFKHDHHCHHEHNHDHGHIDIYLEKRNESLKSAGIALCIALIFHNLPEGMSLGIISKNNFGEGINLMLSLFIHNFIMGITMALPLVLSKMKKKNILALLILSSLPSIIGAIIGYFIPAENNLVSFIVLSFSLAILIFVIYEEIISLTKKEFKWYYILFLIIGFIVSYGIHLVV